MAQRKNGRAPDGDAADFLTAARALHRREKVDLPADMDFGAVYVKTLSAAETRAVTFACLKPGHEPGDEDAFDDDKVERAMIGAALVDGKGRRLIPEGREAEIDDLPQSVQTAINLAYRKLNGAAADPGN